MCQTLNIILRTSAVLVFKVKHCTSSIPMARHNHIISTPSKAQSRCFFWCPNSFVSCSVTISGTQQGIIHAIFPSQTQLSVPFVLYTVALPIRNTVNVGMVQKKKPLEILQGSISARADWWADPLPLSSTILGWTEGTGVWVLEGSEENHRVYERICDENPGIEHNEALKKAGATYYENCKFGTSSQGSVHILIMV